MIEFLFMAAGLIALVRAVLGRTFADRVIAIGAFVNMVVILMVIYAVNTEEVMIIDIALLLILLSFVGTLSIAKFLTPKEEI